MTKLDIAIKFSAVGHAGQFDKGGKPYVLHTLAVLDRVMQITKDPDVHCAAVMHDLLEDTKITRAEIMETFGWRVLQMVQRVTKRKGESHEEYMERVCLSRETMIIKMCDIEHNSDIRRLKNKVLGEKDFARIIKYQKDYSMLEQKIMEQNDV